ncbi:uncharacterized protein G2W53_041227 [Senna tora]|uniref:Uncharacterized protein n=1 Tax=Senna tora TaxID=362788 RepID=A0A834W156_9FABA|nr:uncharacterized protein G2W53_041227 [Senna tora]
MLKLESSRSDLKNSRELLVKSLLAHVSQTDRFAFYLRNRVDLMLELESSWHGRSADNVLTYFGREISAESQKRSQYKKSLADLINVHEVRVNSLVAQVNETDQFELYLRNLGDLMLEFESSRHGRSVDHVLTYCGLAVGSQKHTRRTKSGSCFNIFSMRNCSRILETFTKFQSKVLLHKSMRVVFAKPRGFDARIGVVMAWKKYGSCLNIFRTRNRSRISETYTKYQSNVLLRK